MSEELKQQIENGVRLAFLQYRERHPGIAHLLDMHCSELISSTIRSIENDPEIIDALKIAETETGLQYIVGAAMRNLPKFIGFL